MRIVGKVCAWGAAVGLALLAVGEFNGVAIPSFWVGMFFALFAVESVIDSFCYFKKPKHPYLKYDISYEDGSKESYIEDAEHPLGHTTKPGAAVIAIATTYFESDKDEASKNE